MVLEDFLGCAETAERLIASDEVANRWAEPSALPYYTIAGLAGHLARAVFTVDKYLDSVSAPTGEPTDAAGYLATVLADHDPVDSGFHREVRDRALEEASDGPEALASTVRAVRERLADTLLETGMTRPIAVRDGVTLTVDEYLKTRLVELVVHIDDLSTSIGLAEPEGVPTSAYGEVAAVLGRLAARRFGGPTTIRGLARRERQPDGVRAL